MNSKVQRGLERQLAWRDISELRLESRVSSVRQATIDASFVIAQAYVGTSNGKRLP